MLHWNCQKRARIQKIGEWFCPDFGRNVEASGKREKCLVKWFEPLVVLPDSPQDFPQHCGRFHFGDRLLSPCWYENKTTACLVKEPKLGRRKKTGAGDWLAKANHLRREAYIGGLPERIIGAVFKTADGAITPPVRLNRTPATNMFKSKCIALQARFGVKK